MTKKAGQQFKYLKNEKSLLDGIKSIFRHPQLSFFEANKNNFYGR